MADEGSRITVSEDKLDAKLAKLELSLVDRITKALDAKADAQVVRELRDKIHVLQNVVNAVAHLPVEVTRLNEEVDVLKTARAGQVANSKLIWALATLAVGLIGAVATLVWLSVG